MGEEKKATANADDCQSVKRSELVISHSRKDATSDFNHFPFPSDVSRIVGIIPTPILRV
jgi:hypothetical protein